jgi:hypothetical protein
MPFDYRLHADLSKTCRGRRRELLSESRMREICQSGSAENDVGGRTVFYALRPPMSSSASRSKSSGCCGSMATPSVGRTTAPSTLYRVEVSQFGQIE